MINDMKLDITNQIRKNQRYKDYYQELKLLEKDRVFCKHDFDHFLDVARITVLLANKNNISVDEDIIYAAALLHDMGRITEYKDGTPHHIASCDIAREILEDIDCEVEKKEVIISLIRCHRNPENPPGSLQFFFRNADKISRKCYACDARDKCNWPDEKKNLDIFF